ncbi:MAG: hypothetical protein ABL872_17585 [Lacibacter sp.]
MSVTTHSLARVGIKEYEQVFHEPYHVFNSAEFASINQHKCDSVFPLLYKDSKYRLGIIAGVREGMLISPFSAPFGGFSFLKADVQISAIEQAVILLEEFAAEKGLKGICMVLPPLIYNRIFLTKLINVLYRFSYRVFNLDIDFYIELQDEQPYLERMWKTARQNLRVSQQNDFSVSLCNDDAEKQLTYEIIKENHLLKERPMHMTFEDISQTNKIIPMDFFLLKQHHVPVAGAIVYAVTEDIQYVALWGDLPGFSSMRPMNFLSYHIEEYYQKMGKKYLHFGIATEASIPNYGLCQFKESIGCTITPKLSFEKLF